MEIHPLHGMKKMVAVHTTKKRVQKDIGEEYVEYKTALQNVEKQLKSYCEAAEASNSAWVGLMQTQREFSSNMTATYPRQDAVRATAAQFASNLTALQAASALSDGSQAPWRALHTTVCKYLAEIADVARQYDPVERQFSEYLRYVSKSDKLAGRKKRNEDKISRNLEKREKNRVEFHAKLDATVSTMRGVFRKHPAVFQCALASFWLRNQNSLALFADHTGQMHSECASIADTLIKVDLTNPSTYESLLPANAEPLPLPPPPSVPNQQIPAALPAPAITYGAAPPVAYNSAPPHTATTTSYSTPTSPPPPVLATVPPVSAPAPVSTPPQSPVVIVAPPIAPSPPVAAPSSPPAPAPAPFVAKPQAPIVKPAVVPPPPPVPKVHKPSVAPARAPAPPVAPKPPVEPVPPVVSKPPSSSEQAPGTAPTRKSSTKGLFSFWGSKAAKSQPPTPAPVDSSPAPSASKAVETVKVNFPGAENPPVAPIPKPVPAAPKRRPHVFDDAQPDPKPSKNVRPHVFSTLQERNVPAAPQPVPPAPKPLTRASAPPPPPPAPPRASAPPPAPKTTAASSALPPPPPPPPMVSLGIRPAPNRSGPPPPPPPPIRPPPIST